MSDTLSPPSLHDQPYAVLTEDAYDQLEDLQRIVRQNHILIEHVIHTVFTSDKMAPYPEPGDVSAALLDAAERLVVDTRTAMDAIERILTASQQSASSHQGEKGGA